MEQSNKRIISVLGGFFMVIILSGIIMAMGGCSTPKKMMKNCKVLGPSSGYGLMAECEDV